MAANNNTKVGVTITIFAVVLSAVLVWLSQFTPGKKGYLIEGRFTNVGGLLPGSKVYYMGVKVGAVKANILEADMVKVLLEIDPDIKIPKKVRLNIAAKGLVGDKAIEFFPVRKEMETEEDKNKSGNFKDGDWLDGVSPPSFEDVIVETKNTLLKAQGLISDPELNKSIRGTSKNVEIFTKSLTQSVKQIDNVANNIEKLSTAANHFVGHSNEIVEQINSFVKEIKQTTYKNTPTVENIIKNANLLSKDLEKTANNLNAFTENPQNIKDVKLTMNNVKIAAENVEKMSKSASTLVSNMDLISGDVRDISGDPALKNNFKDLVKNLKNISDSFATLSKQATNQFLNQNPTLKPEKERLHLEFKSEVFGKLKYQFKENTTPTFDVVGNFNLLAHTGFESFPFIQLGVEEIGAANQFNLQAGFYPFNNVMFRLGIVRGKLGGGANYLNEPTNTNLFLDAYDISSPHIRLGLMQNIYKDFGLTASWDNQFITNLNEFALGFRWQPGIL